MTGTLADILAVLGPDLPPALISPEHFTHISAIARQLPGTITHFFGFECLLSTDTPRADFLLRVAANEIGVSILAGDNTGASLPTVFQTHPAWERIGAFCRSWAEPTSPLHDQVNNIWLEFDVPPLSYEERGLRDEVHLPSCFFGPLGCNQAAAQNFKNSAINAALRLLQNDPLPAPAEAKLLDCLAELPEEASVFQVGVMLPRPTEAIRLCIRDMALAQIPTYLARLGWSGHTAELSTLIAHLSHFVDNIILDVDVGQSPLPKIGLECYFDDYKQPQQEPRWLLFLNDLTETGLCRPSKRDGLLAYPGYVREDAHPSAWPDHLRAVAPLLGGHYESFFLKGLHHLKIVYQADRPVQAKAYLYASQVWLPLATLKQQLMSIGV